MFGDDGIADVTPHGARVRRAGDIEEQRIVAIVAGAYAIIQSQQRAGRVHGTNAADYAIAAAVADWRGISRIEAVGRDAM